VIEADHLNLFSLESLDYGATPINYTLLILGFALCALICFRLGVPKVLACCSTGIAAFLVFIYVLGPLHAGYQHAIRYYTPIAIGLAPAIFGMTALQVEKQPRMMWIALAAAMIPVAAFTPSLVSRVQRALRWHSAAAYPWLSTDTEYMQYSRTVLSPSERQFVKAIQEKIPAGEPVLAWMNFPFYFDYRRNRIIDIDPAGIGNPWANWNLNLSRAHYLILDYAGYATPTEQDYRDEALDVGAGERRNAALALDFQDRIDQLVQGGEVLYDNKELKLVRLR
jgi:hypothetical protein